MHSEIGPGPEAPEWLNQCYHRYLDLLDGVFRFVELEAQAGNPEKRLPVYHSGGVQWGRDDPSVFRRGPRQAGRNSEGEVTCGLAGAAVPDPSPTPESGA